MIDFGKYFWRKDKYFELSSIQNVYVIQKVFLGYDETNYLYK